MQFVAYFFGMPTIRFFPASHEQFQVSNFSSPRQFVFFMNIYPFSDLAVFNQLVFRNYNFCSPSIRSDIYRIGAVLNVFFVLCEIHVDRKILLLHGFLILPNQYLFCYCSLSHTCLQILAQILILTGSLFFQTVSSRTIFIVPLNDSQVLVLKV